MNESEQSRTRRRWINLAEIVAVAGVLIGAATLWLNFSEHRADENGKATEARAAAVVQLEGDPDDGGRVLKLSDSKHKIESIDVAFPHSLGRRHAPGADRAADRGGLDRRPVAGDDRWRPRRAGGPAAGADLGGLVGRRYPSFGSGDLRCRVADAGTAAARAGHCGWRASCCANMAAPPPRSRRCGRGSGPKRP